MHRRLVVGIGAAALITVGMLPLPALAAGPDRVPSRIDLGKLDPSIAPRSADAQRQVTVMLQLRGTPAIRAGLTRAVQRTAARDLRSLQADVSVAVERAGGRVLASYQHAYNGLRVRASVGDLARLAALPDVVAIRPLRSYEISNANGHAAIGTSTAWGTAGATGDGVIVAVIDTGIDYTHASFGGSGDPAGYAANDRDVVETDTFPTPKVIAGHDFAGDGYDANGVYGSTTPIPDGDPLDCYGHGTHVAGTIAGTGVNLDGSTYAGRYTAGSVGDGSDYKVAPGIAPEAKLVALKVFGCQGSTDLIVDALDAVAEYNTDHAVGIDIVNLSLGSPFGVSTDPDAVAANNLVGSGVVVVAAAGNEGDVPYITGAPAVATKAISVAAYDAVTSLPMATVDTIGTDVSALNQNAHPGLPVTGPLTVLDTGPSELSLGCEAGDYASVSPGDVVVVKRGDCTFVEKGALAEAAGAAAIIVVNRDDAALNALPTFIGYDPAAFDIPMLGTSRNVPGTTNQMDAALIALDGSSVTLTDAAPVANPAAGQIADFSSSGPRWGDSALKADLAAPGVSVFSTAVGTGVEGTTMSGTSMAAPMTAGAAALVIQGHRLWTPLQVKAALANTADASVVDGYSPLRSGSGLIRVDRAARANVVATTSDGTAALSWGYRQLAGAWSSTKKLTITNDGPTTAKYALSSSAPYVTLSTTSVTVPAGSSVTVRVTARLSKSAVRNLCSPDLWLGPESCDGLYTRTGAITATPVNVKDGEYELRVPFIIVPRGTSSIATSRSATWTTKSGRISGKLLFANSHVHRSYADVYALGPKDPSGDGTHGTDLRATGMQVLSSGVPGNPWLVFAINLHDKYSTASPHEFDVLIDVDGDSSEDYVLFSYDEGLLVDGDYNGRPIVLVWDVALGEVTDGWNADAPLNGSTLLLPALASDFGLFGSGTLRYKVVAWNGYTGGFDATGWSQTFNPQAMMQSQGQYRRVDGNDTAGTGAWFYRVASVKGWLVVALDDPNGKAQADIVKVPKKP